MSIVDIVVPFYNNVKTINFCLQSIFGQDFKDYSLILVNDGSSDGSLDMVNKFMSWLSDDELKKIKIINQENKGSNAARNRGAREGQAKYIIFCDADIKLHPKFLSKTIIFLEKNSNKSFCYTSFTYGWKKFKLWNFDILKLKQGPYIHTTSLILRKHFPGFDENIKRFQDWDLWLTMLENGHTGIWLPEYLFKIMTRNGRISNWLPKVLFEIPWDKIGFKPKNIKEYESAVKIIKTKHSLA
ncbi:glycosyltransferase family 2 protein [Candidatus Parcubacteria bacterium]|nr:MAG: glycosyltransferase family 2 protein [Candidatus Parcubacteria bacterium]